MTARSLAMTPANLARILSGAKTQTRRVATPGGTLVPATHARGTFDLSAAWADDGYLHAPVLSEPGWTPEELQGVAARLCPRWQPGDLGHIGEALYSSCGLARYVSDLSPVRNPDGRPVSWRWKVQKLNARFCPTEYRRTWVRIERVRVERLQAITEGDALAEGVDADLRVESQRSAFARLWDSINARRGYSWESNPWVVALDFALESVTGRPA